MEPVVSKTKAKLLSSTIRVLATYCCANKQLIVSETNQIISWTSRIKQVLLKTFYKSVFFFFFWFLNFYHFSNSFIEIHIVYRYVYYVYNNRNKLNLNCTCNNYEILPYCIVTINNCKVYPYIWFAFLFSWK